MKIVAAVLLAIPIILIVGMLAGRSASSEPLPTVEYVDIDRFMGDWYVIAHIPAFIEDDAYNAIESYRLNVDGTVDTEFTFREGGFDGKLKRYTPRGSIRNTETNAEWGMQFIWPIKADYRIIYLDPEYQTTVVGRNKRDYVWVMARKSSIDSDEFDSIVRLIGEAGYDTSKIRVVPQRW